MDGLPFLEAPYALSEEYWRRIKIMPREVRHWDTATPQKELIEVLTSIIEPELQDNGYQRMSEEVGDNILPKYFKKSIINGVQVLTEIEFHSRNPNLMNVVLIAYKKASEQKLLKKVFAKEQTRIYYLLSKLIDDTSKLEFGVWWKFISKEDFENQCRDILENHKKHGLPFLSDPYNSYDELFSVALYPEIKKIVGLVTS